MSQSPPSRTRLGAAAGLLGAAFAATVIAGGGPLPSLLQPTSASGSVSGNCDEAEHAQDLECAGVLGADLEDDSTSTTDGSTSTAGAESSGEVRTIQAADAGTVMVSVAGAQLTLVMASPNAGWSVEVEQAAGREVEVTFRSGAVRVDVDVELEDGQVRERVRIRDDAAGTELRFENGTLVRSEDDHDNSGPGSHDDDDDDDDDVDDDDNNDDDNNDDDNNDDDSSGPGSHDD